MNTSPQVNDFRLNDTTHHVIIGDSRHMDAVETETVDFVVTSPPYWSIKDYGHEGQIGTEKTPAEYVAKLVAIFREVRRVHQESQAHRI